MAQGDDGGGGRDDGDTAVEPVWLVRIVLILFLLAFAGFLAREVSNVIRAL